MRKIRTYHEVADPAAEDIVGQVSAQRRRLEERLGEVRALVLVGSGKGGVGKSAVAANLAAALAARGRTVGAADADLHGPSLAAMLGASPPLRVTSDGVRPAEGTAGVRVVSTDLLLESPDAPVRWRGTETDPFLYQSVLETGALREMLSDVAWGALDVLVVDLPPGTDKLERALHLVPEPAALLLVTTPSETALKVVGRSIRAALEGTSSPVAVVSNMTAWRCPSCGEEEALWSGDGAHALAREHGVPVWAEVPFDPRLAEATDRGRPVTISAPATPAARALIGLADRIDALSGGGAR